MPAVQGLMNTREDEDQSNETGKEQAEVFNTFLEIGTAMFDLLEYNEKPVYFETENQKDAIASILEKLWTDEKSKEIIEKFDFHLLSKGIVDDTSNTRHRWVETSYVIHHITGSEDLEILEHLKDSKVNPKCAYVGNGM